jgi:hypothetical protein
MELPDRTLKQRAYKELKEFLLIAFYLWLIFGLFIVYKSVVLAEYHIEFAYQGLALINALALAKVMLFAKYVHFGKRPDEEPLIYPTLRKSAFFAVVLACFKTLEEAAVGFYHGKPFLQSIELGGGTWKGILTLTAIMFVVLVPFVGWGELEQVLGEGRLKQLFFGPRSAQNQTTKQAA